MPSALEGVPIPRPLHTMRDILTKIGFISLSLFAFPFFASATTVQEVSFLPESDGAYYCQGDATQYPVSEDTNGNAYVDYSTMSCSSTGRIGVTSDGTPKGYTTIPFDSDGYRWYTFAWNETNDQSVGIYLYDNSATEYADFINDNPPQTSFSHPDGGTITVTEYNGWNDDTATIARGLGWSITRKDNMYGLVYTNEDLATNVTSYEEMITYLNDASYIPTGSTRVLSIDSPSTDYNTVTASTSVDFSVDYLSSTPVADTVCITLDNLTTQQNLIPLCDDVTQSVRVTFATSTTLIDSNQYRWRVVIRDEDSLVIDQTNSYYFTVNTPPYTPFNPGTSGEAGGFAIPTGTTSTSTLSNLTLECDPESGFFSRSVCNVAVLLFVPSTQSLTQLQQNFAFLEQKQPFSTFYTFKEAWDEATKVPDTSYSSLTLTFYGEDIDVVSTTSLAMVAGNNSLETIRYLMAIGLWIAFGWFCFIRVSRFF